MPQIIAVGAQKGGVGKTTTTVNLAAAWAGRGYRVLAIDLDPQFALTRSLGLAPSQTSATVVDVLTGHADVADAAVGVGEGLTLLAGHRDLTKLELTLVAQTKREEFLARALAGQTGGYDQLLIDCPPNLGLLTVNALFAAREVVIPVSMLDPGAYQGAGEMRATVQRLRDQDVDVQVRAVVRTFVDQRRITHRAIDAALDQLGVPIANTQIPLRAEFNNALASGQPLVRTRPESTGALAYARLAHELSSGRTDLRAVA